MLEARVKPLAINRQSPCGDYVVNSWKQRTRKDEDRQRLNVLQI